MTEAAFDAAAPVRAVQPPAPAGAAHALAQAPAPAASALGNQALQRGAANCPAISACPTGGACHSCPFKPRAKLEIGDGSDPLEREADAVADSVIRSGGPALPAGGSMAPRAGGGFPPALRSWLEPRIGHDLRHVRLHTGPDAAGAARTMGARAFTLGSDVYFGAGRYDPASASGLRLIAHEVAHVAQYERGRDRPGVVRRWRIDGGDAIADSSSDRLGILANRLTGSPMHWQCIRPKQMRTATLTPPPADFETSYERYVQVGDVFDVTRLQGSKSGSLDISLFAPGTPQHTLLTTTRFYPGMKHVKDVDEAIRAAATEGAVPLARLAIAGHAPGSYMSASGVSFDPATYSPDQPPPSYSRASSAKLPRRCWLGVGANARFLGCQSTAFGYTFARSYLQKRGTVHTTLRSIQPTCSPQFRTPGPQTGRVPDCVSIDSMGFLPAVDETYGPEHGPYPNAADFHGAPFWDTLAGVL